MSLSMGATAPPIPDQLDQQELPYDPLEAEKWENCRRSINLLRIHGLITSHQAGSAEKKLARRMAADVRRRITERAKRKERA